MYIDSLNEQKNALIESIDKSFMSKKSQFVLMLDKCKNKKRESLGNIYKFVENKKTNTINKEGKYNYYASGQQILKTNEPNFTSEAIIIMPGEKTVIKYNTMFSCSDDNYVIESDDETCCTKFLYYHLMSHFDEHQKVLNGDAIQDFAHDAHALNTNIIEIPSIEDQQQIIEEMDNMYKKDDLTREFIVDLDDMLEYYMKKRESCKEAASVEVSY